MARIAGVNIPQDKIVQVALTYIHGIGSHISKIICQKLNIPVNKRVNSLSEDEVLKIREYIDKNHKVEGDLRREVSMNIKRLVDLASYRGSRHKKKLPIERSNASVTSGTRKAKASIKTTILSVRTNSKLPFHIRKLSSVIPKKIKKISRTYNALKRSNPSRDQIELPGGLPRSLLSSVVDVSGVSM